MSDDLITYTFSEATDLDFKPPTLWYVRNSLGDFVFIKTRDRRKAQEIINSVYGAGKFRVASTKLFY